MNGALWVELCGDIIIARVRGEPTVELLRDCQSQVTQLAREAGRVRVLYDVLEMHPPHVDVPLSQKALDDSLGELRLRRAIVVPTAKLAYLARLAFGDGDYRVFYNDMVAAMKWLTELPPSARLSSVRQMGVGEAPRVGPTGARFVAFHEVPESHAGSMPTLSYAVMMARAPRGVVLVLSRLRQVWELPGGAIDPGESPREAAIRELVEESGCVARDTRWLGVVEVNDGGPRFGALLYCEVDAVPEGFSNAETVAIDYWRGREAPAPLGEADHAVLRRFSPVAE